MLKFYRKKMSINTQTKDDLSIINLCLINTQKCKYFQTSLTHQGQNYWSA